MGMGSRHRWKRGDAETKHETTNNYYYSAVGVRTHSGGRITLSPCRLTPYRFLYSLERQGPWQDDDRRARPGPNLNGVVRGWKNQGTERNGLLPRARRLDWLA